ncbi:MAG: hypothetical protein JSW11_05145 [Candidatus Heimdallarchaeota archaeon]|nr:MAG: hypothetical protein JSW11_05145 [Candidatus Heimdallarchaeota archaeon]
MSKYKLYIAKVPLTRQPRPGQPGKGLVICFYDTNPKLVQELEQYADEKITYGHWKTDADTITEHL